MPGDGGAILNIGRDSKLYTINEIRHINTQNSTPINTHRNTSYQFDYIIL